MSNDKFRVDLRQRIADAKENLHSVARKVVLDVGTRLVERSPVGNKELWAINDLVHLQRETYQVFRESQGKKRVSERTLKKKFKSKGPAGYVGGRFRANWQLAENAVAIGELYDENASNYPNRQQVVDAMDANITNNPAGKVFYFSNNLPYAQRLEDGWSSQAPEGMVALTTVEFGSIVAAAVKQ